MDQATIEERVTASAEQLYHARLTCRPIPVLSLAWPSLDESKAYAVAAAVEALISEPVVGYKLGYTSATMRAQMKVREPNYGSLYASTRVHTGGLIASDRLIHPLVEPEIALTIAYDIHDEVKTAIEAAKVIDAVMPALEIVDTRYERYEFTSVDNIADNSSAARFVLGPQRSVGAIGDLRVIPVRLARDGTTLATGTGADVMGDPLLALAWFVSRRIREGKPVRAGTVVLTGGICAAQAMHRGSRFVGDFGPLGTVICSFDRPTVGDT